MNKLRSIRHVGFEDVTLAALVAQVEAWIRANAGDHIHVSTEYRQEGAAHYALITYAEE